MTIAFNLTKVLQRIEHSVNKYRTEGDLIRLIAVSKTRPSEMILTAHEQGQKDFGESYVQEAIDKIEQLEDMDICWHFIGPVQSNKTSKIAQYFDWCQSVDRLKIARRLSNQRPDDKPPLNICIQLNVSHELTKSGTSVNEALELARAIDSLPNLVLRGLMAIPMKTDNFDSQREAFAEMYELYTQLKDQYDTVDTLSMGMSGDMEAAIAEGSNMVRVGTDIFGPRK